jgi:hypothetical protein
MYVKILNGDQIYMKLMDVKLLNVFIMLEINISINSYLCYYNSCKIIYFTRLGLTICRQVTSKISI